MALIVVRSPQEWSEQPQSSARAAVAIGNFDGVHLGHQEILKRAVQRAREKDSLSAVITFYPHPLETLRPESAPLLLMTLPQRLAALEAAGIDAALVLDFNRALSLLSPEEFVRPFLVECLRARLVLVGANFKFGHKQAGDAALLARLGGNSGFEIECIPPIRVGREIVSSSAIRAAVAEGDMARAARMLGRPYSLSGEVRSGTGMGRKLVVPTLNLSTEQELFPKAGVYATETILPAGIFRSATNVGVRPTFDGRTLAVESHLLDFSSELGQGPMEVRFWTRLRDERKFSSPDELKAQVMKDVQRARDYFRRIQRLNRKLTPG